MPVDKLMRTTDYLDRLDPVRPTFRRLAIIRFNEGQYDEFLLDLGDYNGWRFSPTGQYLAAKCFSYLGKLEEAETARADAWELWQETLEGEEPLCEGDRIRLHASFAILDARISCARGDHAASEKHLARTRELLGELPDEDFSDLEACLEDAEKLIERIPAEGVACLENEERPVPT